MFFILLLAISWQTQGHASHYLTQTDTAKPFGEEIREAKIAKHQAFMVLLFYFEHNMHSSEVTRPLTPFLQKIP